MGWEKRGNGWYYYRKKRVGRRVVSEYIGRGELAEAIAILDRTERARRASERERQQDRFDQMCREAEAIDDILNEPEQTIEVLTEAYLLTLGCHTHKGQWRKKDDRQRGGSGSDRKGTSPVRKDQR